MRIQIPCVIVPMGQYTHQDLGRNRTMVTKPSTVEVSITLKNPKANCAIHGETISTSAHCQGSSNTQSSVTVCCSGAPVNTLYVLNSIKPNMVMKKARNP